MAGWIICSKLPFGCTGDIMNQSMFSGGSGLPITRVASANQIAPNNIPPEQSEEWPLCFLCLKQSSRAKDWSILHETLKISQRTLHP